MPAKMRTNQKPSETESAISPNTHSSQALHPEMLPATCPDSAQPRYRNNYYEAPWSKALLKILWVAGNARSAGLDFFCVLLLLGLCRMCFEFVFSFRLFWVPRPLHGRLTRTFSGYPDYTSRRQTLEKTFDKMFATNSSEHVSPKHIF